MKFLLSFVVAFAIVISNNAFAGNKEENKECCKESKEKCCESKKSEKAEAQMCDMKVSGKVTKVECDKDKDKPCKCVITTAEGEEVIVWCKDKDKAEQLSKCEGKEVTIIGKGVEKKEKDGKCHRVIKSIEKIEEAPSAPEPEK